MINNSMMPRYNTVLFTEVWEDVDAFLEDYGSIGIPTTISETNATTLFYLLYARYGNNPIANRDITQWKYKIFSIIYQYGPTWEKKLDIQDKLRAISDADLLKGSKSIFNHAFNPSTTPSTGTLEELDYINDQSTSNYKKSKMDAYMQLWELLKTDVTKNFLNEFKRCFKIFVSSERPLLYVSEEVEDDSEEDN